MALKLESTPATERDPIADAKKVVEHLRSVGTIDTTYKKVLGALQNNDAFIAQLEQLMKDKKVLQEGVALTELQRKKAPRDFTFGNDKQILEIAKTAIWDILNDESEQGLAADNKITVHQALVTMLEDEEVVRQNLFQQLHQQRLQEQQQQQQPNIPAFGGQG